MKLNNIEEIIADIREGKMVILMDDEDRENEGDIIMAASKVEAVDINFMARYGRGLICLTLTRDRCEQLKLPLMVNDNSAAYGTNFTLSIEAAHGVTTGISAADRATTVQAAVAPDAGPADIVQPGHIFPIMAQPGGVLTRAGHTEAGCDLARLAGLEPAAVIVEVLNEDGSMARRPDLEVFAKEFGLKIGTIADLIEYRLQKEHNLDRIAECQLKNSIGEFKLVSYRDLIDNQVHLAIVKGEIDGDTPTLVRVHMPHYLHDVLGMERPDSGWPLKDAMKLIESEGSGVIIMLSQQDAQEGMVERIKTYQAEDEGRDMPHREPSNDLRMYGRGAQILLNLGVRKMRVLSAPKRMHGLSGFGLEVVEYVSG
ncbi:MAG: bifunctional 3,4-dihydroxy-2-butanone-4-phosphate synthase/GTP cyclohydrolase II [Gammaproteobacteria bacterium]|nr:bifunctional 3,4-dihydroxy-2-butanone-4-phosphate synthase/GTP cyclohydrolase II [Gammaproteobacteria bacterium]MDH5799317.1 bifunctional 3,4-dihydroxy-2-butanone-4-phosphate synthase/GTP cyclohydrolase II [Gammaproteobacteria bacterium]